MGYWLRDKVKSWTSLALDDIQRWDLPKSGVVSAIQIEADLNRHATDRTANTKAAPLEDGMDAVEVIEGGSKVIKSIDGAVLMGHNLFDFLQIPYYQQAGMTNDGNIVNFFVNFGRYPQDTLYGLDLAKHEECQLVIDHNFDDTAKTGFKADSVAFTLYIWRYIGAEVSPVGYFKTSEKEAYTQGTTSGAEHRLLLPTKNPIRRLLIRSYLTKKTPEECITELELQVNDGEYKPVYLKPFPADIAYYAQKGIRCAARGSDGVYATATDVHIETNLPRWQEVSAVSRYGYGTQANALQFTQEGGDLQVHVSSASFEVMWTVKGSGYQYITPVCFDIPDEAGSYFPTADLSKLELVITEKGQASANKIVLDELVTY